MTKPNKTKPLSIRALAKKTGADRASIAKWIEGMTDETEALATIRERQKAGKAKPAIDPETGLSWFQARQREIALRERREREKAEAVLAKEWMATADHFRVISIGVGKLEQIPARCQSELGFTPAQVDALRRMLDEAREEWAKEIEA